jgi:ribose transport system ATP-binding protein
MENKKLLLKSKAISKQFHGVVALDKVDFEVYEGEVIGFVGENGAGKSTLIKILSGVYTPDSGSIQLNGENYRPNGPYDAQKRGISTIYQELSLIPYLSVAENIFLNREPRLPYTPGLINYSKMNHETQLLLGQLKLNISATEKVVSLPIAAQQMVEIARCISRSAQLIIMDEPTSSLASSDIDLLFVLIQQLKEQGVSIIFIGHRMEEVLAIADRIIVLRDGERVGMLPIADATEQEIIRLMVGRKVDLYPKLTTERGSPVLEVRNLSDGKYVQGVNFEVHQGEIVGMAGLIGAGRTEVARMIFGADPKETGQIFIDGLEKHITSPVHAIQSGIGLIPEDRKQQGLVLGMDVMENITLSILRQISNFIGLLKGNQQLEIAEGYWHQLDIQTPGLWQTVRNLSGGNQQKVVISKWLSMKSKLLILDEPTRGIDIGAKAEVHNLMSELASQGIGILMISSELPEIIGMSDRVIVMSSGRITGEFSRAELQHPEAQEEIIARATEFTKTL